MQTLIGIFLFAISLLVASGALAVRWWRNRTGSRPTTGLPSDLPPPAKAIDFNQAIVAACGPHTDAAFQLGLLTSTKPLSVAIALRLSREEIERRLIPPVPVVAVANTPASPLVEVAKS